MKLNRIDRNDVKSPETFARYCQQRMGIPYPTGKTIAALRKAINNFFEQYPWVGYETLVRTADWCHSRGKRYSTPMGVLSAYNKAWASGYLPELAGPPAAIDGALEASIEKALTVEDDPKWRDKLMASSGPVRKEIYEAWVAVRSQDLLPC